MAFGYPTSFRERRASECSRVNAPRSSPELEVSTATLFRWKKQALIDVGRKPGTKSHEPDELARAQQRIKDLETELELVKKASALFNGEEVVRPKGSAGSFKD